MKRMTYIKAISIFSCLSLAACNENPSTQAADKATAAEPTGYETIDTRIGELTFEHNYLAGIPTEESRKKIFDAIDFQRACQAYIWSIPMTGFYAWKQSLYDMGGEDGQIHFFESHQSKLGGLTYNASTPYVISFFNVAKSPVVITIPTNEVRGAVHNAWQIGLSQMTEPGTYVITSKGSGVPSDAPENATIVESDTNYVFFGVRLMAKSEAQRQKDLNGIQLANLKGELLSSKGINRPEKGVDGKQPRGMAFWHLLNEAIQEEPVLERDRIIHDMLRPLGVEKGVVFNPNTRQTALLEESVVVGEIMAKNIDFSKSGRLKQSEYGSEGVSWEIATASTPEQNRAYGVDLDGRAAWFYEAVTNDIAMHGMVNGGWGQVYLDNYRDADGNGLDGGKHYTLTIPSDVNYAETFWTITVYNIENRALINNSIKRADVGSNIDGTQKDSEGNYVFHFSPKKPEGVAVANWIQTNPGENWFVYFRAYSPSKEFVAQAQETLLPNFILVKQ